VLKVAKFEIRKSGKRYGGVSLLLIVFAVAISVSMSYASILTGIDSDEGYLFSKY